MSQEGLQLRRKNKRVASGKRQSFESHFLFNFLLDVLENLETRRKQEISLSQKSGMYRINRISLLAEST